ncbi:MULTISPECIES: LysR family transcriptional regulator [unclassified Pseudomonas]|uniref:LysR family transcriptional regulator n=1 Tax=unclassified Pseudomonas TaxID=196821 RepID=UPI00384C36DB
MRYAENRPFKRINFSAMKKIVRLDDLQVFVTTVKLGSFSAAARLLDTSPAFASAAIQRLEASLGVRLFVRSTRRLRVSDDGERYLPHAQAAINAMESGEMALDEGRGNISGPIRLSMPSDLGRNVLLPWLNEFQNEHPDIQLQLRISDQVADFFTDQIDVSIRYGQLADSSLIALPLAPLNTRTVCASPTYITRFGKPETLEDLARHNCLRFVMSEQTYERWTFHTREGVKTVAVTGDRISDDADIVRRWGVEGAGILYKSRIDVSADLKAGNLVELFPQDVGQPAPLQMVCAHRNFLTPAIHKLRTFLAMKCDDMLMAPSPDAAP